MTASMPQPTPSMKIRAERAALTDALSWVARAVPKNPPAPVLAGIRVSAADGVVTLSAFDYETQHTAAIEATVGDDGEVVIPGLFFRDAVLAGRGSDVDLILDGSQLEITSGRSTFRARCFVAEEAPDLPAFPAVHGVVSAEALREAVGDIAPAVSDDTVLSEAAGIHIEGEVDRLTLVATDRHRFHATSLPWKCDEPFEVTVPGRRLVEAVKGMAETVEVGVAENLLGLSDGRHQWTTRRYATQYIQWRRGLAAYGVKCQDRLSVDRDDLLAAVKQVGAMAQHERPILLQFDGTELVVRTPEQDQGDGHESLPAIGDTPVTLASNHRFLADAIGVCGGPIELLYGGSYEKSGAFIVADQSKPDLTLIVMSKTLPGGTR